jgi:hypothetical protein
VDFKLEIEEINVILYECYNNRFDLLRWSHVFINNVLSDWPICLIDCKFSENLITKVEIGNQERGKKLLRKINYEGGIIGLDRYYLNLIVPSPII